MIPADHVPSARAAEILAVSQQEVRRLVKSGALRGVLVANRLLVDRASLEHRASRAPAPGRPLTALNAWAMLRLLSAAHADFLGPVVRSRLRKSLLDATPDRVRSATVRRADVRRYRVLTRYLPRLAAESGLLRTGLSAVDGGFDLVVFEAPGLDAYCTDATCQRLVSSYGLVPGDETSEVTLRGTPHLDLATRAGRDENSEAVVAAVCVDLMDSVDPRAVAAGRSRLETLIDTFTDPAAR